MDHRRITGHSLEARVEWIRSSISDLRKRGAVVQLSGGIDSSVVLHLCVRALGAERVTALFLPDGATDPSTEGFARMAALNAGCVLKTQSIDAFMDHSAGDAITTLIRRHAPAYDPAVDGFVVNASTTRARRLGALVYELGIGPRHGRVVQSFLLSSGELRQLIAYQNRKQRTRMLCAYAEAEAHNLAVVGASNADELQTGFVVKYGDDAADICAIGDMEKCEVYRLAAELGVPADIIARPPTTDTFALVQTQTDYYYPLPVEVLRVLAGTAATRLSERTVESLLPQCPGWSADGLRQVAAGLRAGVRYQATRSALISDYQEEGRING